MKAALVFLFLALAGMGPLAARSPETPAGISSATPANCTIVPVPTPGPEDVVQITADHPDWTYALGEAASFHIKIASEPYPAEGVPITYRLGPEQFEGPSQKVVVPAEGLTINAGTRDKEGLTRIVVSFPQDGKIKKWLCTAAYAPGLIRPTQTEPADFDTFWNSQKATLAQIPPETELVPLPNLSTPEVEVFQWSAQNVGSWEGPSRMYGILCVPRGPGPFPAMMNPPGAGVRPYFGEVALAKKGVITLQIGIHGMPVTLDKSVYDALSRGGLNNYAVCGLDDRNSYYYRRVYLGCLRANDFLTSHPKWDGKNLLVSGASQGGMLSIVTAALDPRVTLVSACYPAYCDMTGYLNGRAGGWPGLFRPAADGKLQVLAPDEPRLVTTTYYDTLNFAKRLKVPGFYSFGYNDDVCPPTSMFAAYNCITAPKELVIAPQQGHKLSPPQVDLRTAWFNSHLGLK